MSEGVGERVGGSVYWFAEDFVLFVWMPTWGTEVGDVGRESTPQQANGRAGRAAGAAARLDVPWSIDGRIVGWQVRGVAQSPGCKRWPLSLEKRRGQGRK